MTSLSITFRQGRLSDLNETQELFVNTINAVCKADYNDQQIKVWTSSVGKTERWIGIIVNQLLLIAQENDKIVGFCSLDNYNFIDLFYVHKDKQGQGIARQLYRKIELEAIKNGQKQLTSDVSITARPFFEKNGFRVISKQTVIKQEVELTNFRMAKNLK